MTTNVRQADFVTGVETGDLPTAGTPTNPNDLITLDYADKNYQQGTSGRDNIAAIKAIAEADRKDKDLVFNKATNEEYYFDSGSSAVGDDDFVLVPDAGTGRWLKRTILNKQVNFTDTTSSTTKDTGAMVLEGGLGVEENINVGGNVVIEGNLTVSGTTTTVDTATLDVTDANITVNDGGDQTTANTNVAGFTVEMSDATDTRMGYDSSLTSRFKCGDVGSESEIITAAGAQTFTGVKTFDTETINQEIATPSNPSAGFRKLYFKSDGKLYTLDSGGVELVLGEGVTSVFRDRTGIVNNIENHNVETDTSGYALYDDGALSDPVDGTGDAGGLALVLSRETGVPLRQVGSLRIDSPAATDTRGQGVSYDFTRDEADIGTDLRVQFDYRFSGTTVADNIKVYIYDKDAAALISVGGNTDLFTLDNTATSGTIGAFIVPAADIGTNDDFRLIFHHSASNAAAFSLFADGIVAGNGIANDGKHGLLQYYNTEKVTVTGSGSFTSGELRLSRVNNVVTVQIAQVCGHASASAATSAAGLIPVDYRPDNSQGTARFDGSGHINFQVNADGSFTQNYRDFAGATQNRTSAGFLSITFSKD